jgi:hypothetical protein
MALTALVKGRTPPALRKTRGLANRNSFNPCREGQAGFLRGAVSPAIPL